MSAIIDLERALDRSNGSNEAAKIHLLSSQEMVRLVLESQPPEFKNKCHPVFKRLLEDLKDWGGKDQSNGPSLIGWLNLLKEICPGVEPSDPAEVACDNCVDTNIEGIFFSPLLRLFLCRADLEKLKNAILLRGGTCKSKANGIDFAKCSKAIQFWDELLEPKDGRFRIGETDFGQTLVMHLLEEVLDAYNQTASIADRCVLNLLLVPLLRAVFRNPDRAHLVYFRYHGTFAADDFADQPFDMLYRQELAVAEEFRSRSVRKRNTLLEIVQRRVDVSADEETLPTHLKQCLNLVLHGDSEEDPQTQEPRDDVKSPFPKMTRVAQITCFIRDSSSRLLREDRRKYVLHLKGVHFRRAVIIDAAAGCAPGHMRWSGLGPVRANFEETAASVYLEGHDTKTFENLFGDGPVAWVQDGEITLLWFCCAILRRRLAHKPWNPRDAQPVKFEAVDFGLPSDAPPPELYTGQTLDEFLTRHCVLFYPSGKPTAKLSSFVNFLERVVVSNRPKFYKREKHWQQLCKDLLQHLVDPKNPNPKDAFPNIVATIERFLNDCDHEAMDSYRKGTRVPTFLLEAILRDGENVPYSLFFHPITFDPEKDKMEPSGRAHVPGVFLAGTFAGLEWGCFPSVTARQDYHELNMLDAIRPIVDREIGRVLRSDQERVRDGIVAEDRARTAEAREEAMRSVLDSVTDLTNLFRQAEKCAFNIRFALDPSWSDLFSGDLHLAFEGIFSGKKPLGISAPRLDRYVREGSNPTLYEELRFPHKIGGDCLAELHHLLVYLARERGGFRQGMSDGKTFYVGTDHPANDGIDTLSAWSPFVGERVLFPQTPFFRSVYRYASTLDQNPGRAASLLALLKILFVDSMDPTRGIYLVQLAAALGLCKRIQSKEDNLVFFPTGDPIPGSFKADEPETETGIHRLCEIVTRDPEWLFAPGKKRRELSTGELTAKARLAGDTPPNEFLRALKLLVGDALAPSSTGESEKVCLSHWTLKLLQPEEPSVAGEIVADIYCNGAFSPDVQQVIWNYSQSSDDTYHNLRQNVVLIARSIGSPPNFLTVPSVPDYSITQPGFTVFRYGDSVNPQCCIRLRIGRTKPENSR